MTRWQLVKIIASAGFLATMIVHHFTSMLAARLGHPLAFTRPMFHFASYLDSVDTVTTMAVSYSIIAAAVITVAVATHRAYRVLRPATHRPTI